MEKEKPTYQELENQIAELKLQNEILQSAEKSEVYEDRLKAILALKQSEEMFRTTLYCIGDGVITTDASGFVKQLNAVAEKLTGWKEQEAKGIPVTKVFNIINEETLHVVESPVEIVLREGNIVGLANHTMLIAKDGSQIPIADSGAPIKNEKGEIVGAVLVFRDQSKERNAQRLIAEALSRLERAEIASKSGNWELHLDSKMVITSDGAQKIYGITGDQLDYEYIKSIPLPEYRSILDAALKSLIEDDLPYDIDFKIKLPHTGEIKDIHSLCYFDKKKRILFGTIQDITRQKQIESALRKSEELLKVFFDSNMDMMFVKDDQRRYLLANKAMANFFGKYKRDLIGKTDEVLAENSRIYPCISSDLKALDTVNPFTVEEHLGDRIFETTKFTLKQNGHKGIGGIIRDITERKRGEKLIRTFGKAVEQSPVAITITDADGNIEFVNKEYITLTQYTLDDLKGKKPRIFNSGHLSPSEYETMWKTLHSGQTWKSEYVNRKKDHTEFQVEVIISAIQQSDQSISNYVIVMDDVTEKKNMINELIIAKDRAEESERLKSAFLANMSHEIRTPMNGILGFAELLKEPDLTGEEQQKYIAIIEQSGARMLNIINDIISISKIESGLMKVNIQSSNINDQIDFIYTFFKPEVERKGMTISSNYTLSSEEAILFTDKEKVYAILINLVKNAIKYSESGAIAIGYISKDNYLEFYVKDTGIGIPKERQEVIFERFIQADITDKSALQGAGLGLSISKAYVEMLGGSMWVESEVGQGSTFYFTLPYPG
ncbi:MAG: PAS domain S-box protein [Bacteroidales bacterium]|nr:PAS domain S-box protein [Bacteroidales bacterium]